MLLGFRLKCNSVKLPDKVIIMQENQENEDTPEEAPKKSGGMMKEILIYLVAMVVMTVIAVVVVTILFKDNSGGDATASEPPEAAAPPVDADVLPEKDDPVYTFDPPIIVNTADPEATRFLSVKIHLVFRKADAMGTIENSPVFQYQIRDLFITTFSAKTSAELQRNEEKDELKRYLKAELNHFLGRGSVKQVYFSEYVIQ